MLTKKERAVIAERLKSTEYITSSTLFKALTGEEKTKRNVTCQKLLHNM